MNSQNKADREKQLQEYFDNCDERGLDEDGEAAWESRFQGSDLEDTYPDYGRRF